MIKNFKHKKNSGFTLIEVMIAMAIFTIIITIGMGAVLNAMQQQKSSQSIRTVMDSLNFAMEDMARNIRLGANIRCTGFDDTDVYDATSDMVTPQNCLASNVSILFNDYQGKLLKYSFSPYTNQIVKKSESAIGGFGTSADTILTPPEVSIDTTQSGFTVRGAPPTSGGDASQPTVVIRLSGSVTVNGTNTKFNIQTTVTPRALDV